MLICKICEILKKHLRTTASGDFDTKGLWVCDNSSLFVLCGFIRYRVILFGFMFRRYRVILFGFMFRTILSTWWRCHSIALWKLVGLRSSCVQLSYRGAILRLFAKFIDKHLLTHFMPLISFDTPWKQCFHGYQKRSLAWNRLTKICKVRKRNTSRVLFSGLYEFFSNNFYVKQIPGNCFGCL